MTKVTSLLFLLFLTTNCFSQEKIKYFDADWEQTDKENMVYYRPLPQLVNGKYLFKDYYKSGKLQSEGMSLSQTEDKFEGIVKYYAENGQLTEESSFENGKLNGKSTGYDEKGRVIFTGTNKDGDQLKRTTFLYKGDPDDENKPLLFNVAIDYEGEERVKQTIYDTDIHGIRAESYFAELKAKFYDTGGKLLGEMIFGLDGNPNNGIIVEYIYEPSMRVDKIITYKDGVIQTK